MVLSSSARGCWPVARSMIESRTCPRPDRASGETQIPLESGPRCLRTSRASLSSASTAVRASPQSISFVGSEQKTETNPHITQDTPYSQNAR
ncbi:unnamed protein product [Mycena citricolor]|uniref:Uncharacterized protein n=1 Tax=Mycena citricolor TaxID=2018698 RepID=A0AAD2Q6N7_9AGAR|nr:unnamed protein product [Mycena citricolor]